MRHSVLMDHIRISGANEMLYRGGEFDASEIEAADYRQHAPHLAEPVADTALAQTEAAPKPKRGKAG